jgi:histidine triad (HIT) family protein
MGDGCAFCAVINNEASSNIVFKNADSMAFLDTRPVFHGHCLLVPLKHVETFMDADDALVSKLFVDAKRVSEGIKRAMHSEGILIIVNNNISQSIPHLHIHIIPRNNGDGLKGFMWPRHPYVDDKEAVEFAEKIRKELSSLN